MSSRYDKEERELLEQDVMSFLKERAFEEHEKFTNQKNRATTLAVAREQLFLEQFQEVASKVLKNKIVPSKYALSKHKTPKKRIANLTLSDLHFGSNLDLREVPLPYGPSEEARRLAAVVLQTAEYKRFYREETTLFIHLLGDIIQGQLHDMRDGLPLAEQVAAAIHLLSQAISFLSQHYPAIVVRCTPGNHGRNTARHKNRATNQKWDSIETIIYYALKTAAAALPNVSFEIPYTPYYTYNAFNKRAFFTHGDTVLNPGYPGRSIDVAGVRKQINEINGKLAAHEQYTLFMVGHVHIGSCTHLPNGAIFMTNGCLVPPDGYGVSIGCLDTACGQWIWESVEDHIIGDERFIAVGDYNDKDKSLEKIIKPFQSL